MSINASNFRMFRLSNGTPNNDTDPIGGTMTTTEWDPDADTFTASVPISPTDPTVVYGAAGWRLAVGTPEDLGSLKLALRTAMHPNEIASFLSIRSTSTADTGVVKILTKIDGDFTVDAIDAEGTNTVTGEVIADLGSVYWAEYVQSGAPTIPKGNITISASGQILGVIFGTDSGLGISQVNSLAAIALGTAKNTVIAWSGDNNRLTAPTTNAGSFATGAFWPGTDNALSAGYTLDADDYFQFAVRVTIPAAMPLPPDSGRINIAVMPMGIEV